MLLKFMIYSDRLNLSLFEQTKQSQIEANFVRAPNEEHHCQIGKGDEEDRFGEVAVVQKGTNSTDPSINLETATGLSQEIQGFNPRALRSLGDALWIGAMQSAALIP